jgi:hypothetical protein
MIVGRFYIVFLPARRTLWPSLLASSVAIVAAGLLLALGALVLALCLLAAAGRKSEALED